MQIAFVKPIILVAATFFLLDCSAPQSTLYVGHHQIWTDGGGRKQQSDPTKFTMQFSADGGTATMRILDSVGRVDSILLRRKNADDWDLVEWQSRRAHDALAVDILTPNDSMIVSISFGLAVEYYFGKRQSAPR